MTISIITLHPGNVMTLRVFGKYKTVNKYKCIVVNTIL